MSLFGNDKKDEYDLIYERKYELIDENEDLEERIERLRGTIGRGDCVYCSAKNGMVYDGHICFICLKCGKSVHEDIYYGWAAGKPINFEE